MYSQNNSYGFSIGTQFGFVHGQSLELVYPQSGETKNIFLSELRYDMKPVFYYGLTADFGKKNPYTSPGFLASLSFKAGIPGRSGTHENRDWISSADDTLTNFSSHNNITKEMYIADIILGAAFPTASNFYIKTFLAGSWMRFSFSGKDGYIQYANSGTNGYNSIKDAEKIPCYGEVITYKQDWFLLAMGFSFGTEIFNPFSLNFSLKMSPLTYCTATDHHKLRNAIFKDFTSFGFYYEPGADVSILLKQFELSLNFAYRYIGKTKGETYVLSDEKKQYSLSPNKAGAGLSIIDTRLLATWYF